MNTRQKRAFKEVLKVSTLKDIIKDMDDDALVFVPSFDHSYRSPAVFQSTALLEEHGEFTEDFGEEYTPESEYGPRIQALIIE